VLARLGRAAVAAPAVTAALSAEKEQSESCAAAPDGAAGDKPTLQATDRRARRAAKRAVRCAWSADRWKGVV